jgi:hypothetical protein
MIPKMIHLSEKQKIIKNFVAFNLSFVLIFASFDDIAMIASVLNQDGRLGNVSQAVLYVFQFLSALVWPQVFIEIIGFKFSLAIAECGFLLFFIANAFPSWFTLMPTSALAGFSNSMAWTILGCYFTILSKRYSLATSKPFANCQTLFFGCFGSIFFLSINSTSTNKTKIYNFKDCFQRLHHWLGLGGNYTSNKRTSSKLIL